MRRLFTSVSSHREKMICRILLLIILTSCVCAATFVVNVPQSSYQAEEKHSITLEWTFPTKPDSSWSSLYIICELITDHTVLLLYRVHEGAEVSESQDEEFAGRVQSDKDALREGRIRLNVSRLRTEDSGLYLCEVKNEYGSGSGRCRLNVTAGADLSQPQRPTESPQPSSRGRIGLYAALGLTGGAGAVALLIKLVSSRCFTNSTHNTANFRVVIYQNPEGP
ncbi:programmed cell death 1 ligand 1-like [Odontesthes bonariensis]